MKLTAIIVMPIAPKNSLVTVKRVCVVFAGFFRDYTTKKNAKETFKNRTSIFRFLLELSQIRIKISLNIPAFKTWSKLHLEI